MKKKLICLIAIIVAILMLIIAVINSPSGNTTAELTIDQLRTQFKNANELVQSYTLVSNIVDVDGDNSKAVEYINYKDGLYTSDYTFTTTSNGIDTQYRYDIFAKDDIKTEAVQDVDGEWTVKTTKGNKKPILGLGTALDVPAEINEDITFTCDINPSECTDTAYIVDTEITADDYKITYKFSIDKNTLYITHVTINEYSDGATEPTTIVQQEYTDYNNTTVDADSVLLEKIGSIDNVTTADSPYLIEETSE